MVTTRRSCEEGRHGLAYFARNQPPWSRSRRPRTASLTSKSAVQIIQLPYSYEVLERSGVRRSVVSRILVICWTHMRCWLPHNNPGCLRFILPLGERYAGFIEK